MPKNKPGIVDVPPMNFVAVRGRGDPNEEGSEYKQTIGLLYATKEDFLCMPDILMKKQESGFNEDTYDCDCRRREDSRGAVTEISSGMAAKEPYSFEYFFIRQRGEILIYMGRG